MSELSPYVEQALVSVASRGASDLHVIAGLPPWVRHGAQLQPDAGARAITRDEIESLAEWAGGKNVSLSREAAGCRWRVSAYMAIDGWRVQFRIIPAKPPSFQQLGLPDSVRALAGLHHGLVITAGATGSGKTTTLAALISSIISSQQIHLLTIEEPIEYLYDSSVAVVTQRELGDDLDSQTALEMAMRSDIDVILFGEIRRASDANLCLELAASGHLVFTTLHARDAGTVCERIDAMTGRTGRSVLAQVLRAIITQQLLPSATDPTVRHLAAEVLIMNHAFRQMMRPDGQLTRIESTLLNERQGMDVVIADLIRADKITRAAGMASALNPQTLERELSGVHV